MNDEIASLFINLDLIDWFVFLSFITWPVSLF